MSRVIREKKDPRRYLGMQKQFIGKNIDSVERELNNWDLTDISPVVNRDGKIIGFIDDADNDGYFKGKEIDDFGMEKRLDFYVYTESVKKKTMSRKYEDFKLSKLHFIETTGNKDILVDGEYFIRVIKEDKETDVTDYVTSIAKKFKKTVSGSSVFDRDAIEKEVVKKFGGSALTWRNAITNALGKALSKVREDKETDVTDYITSIANKFKRTVSGSSVFDRDAIEKEVVKKFGGSALTWRNAITYALGKVR